MWDNNRVSNILGATYPIIQAPMAGASTPELVVSVCNAGGIGSLGAAKLSLNDLKTQCTIIRENTNRPFNVNFFAHPEPEQNNQKIENMIKLLENFYHQLGIAPVLKATNPIPTFGKQQLEIILDQNPGIVSFHFGLPKEVYINALKEKKIKILSTATTIIEALDLEKRGADIVIAQGYEAGGHRGTYMDDAKEQTGSISLIPQISDAISIPTIAAGGINDGRGIAAAMLLGAEGVQIGTGFLLANEASCNHIYRRALKNSNGSDTCITYGFSGRPARAIKNKYTMATHGMEKLLPNFPIPATLLQEIQAASIKERSPDYLPLWCGQSVSLTLEMPAEKIIKKFAQDTEKTLKKFSK